MPKQKTADVGVIVGRFQVPELHQAHIDLFEAVLAKHGKVLVFLGLAPVMATKENPLDFEARKQMILEIFPEVIVAYVKDHPRDEVWSMRLDSQISDLITPSQSVVLYGGRDSFIDRYHGKHETEELESAVIISGSEIRKNIYRQSVRGSADFRAGVIWATSCQFPATQPTVDIAIFNEDYTKILLGKKTTDWKHRLIGGFCEPGLPYEANARKEVQEETNLAITDPEYIGSYIIDDWRYRGEPDRKITTALFGAKVFSGAPKAGDDIAEVQWFPLTGSKIIWNAEIMPSHAEILEASLAYAEKKRI